MWLMLLEFPNGVRGWAHSAKVEVASVLGFASVLRLYECSALHSYTRKQISFPAPPRSTWLQMAISAPYCGAAFRLG